MGGQEMPIALSVRNHVRFNHESNYGDHGA